MEHSLLLQIVHLFPHSIFVEPVRHTRMLRRVNIKLDRGWRIQCNLTHEVLAELLVVDERIWVVVLVVESLLQSLDGLGNVV